jgi:hypothetical protein
VPKRIPRYVAAHARRAYWNLRLLGLPEPVKDLWLVALSILLVVSLIGQNSRIDTQGIALDTQRIGRGVAIRTLCGAQQGVITAGRHQLLRFGQKHAAREYARTVARAVQRQAHVRGLIDPASGQLRCERLVAVAHARP